MKSAPRKQSTLATDLRVRGNGTTAFVRCVNAGTWIALQSPARSGDSTVNYATL